MCVKDLEGSLSVSVLLLPQNGNVQFEVQCQGMEHSLNSAGSHHPVNIGIVTQVHV